MPTYVYETISAGPDDPPRRFEVRQSMKDAPLQTHPVSGALVRRLIQGGYLNTQRRTKGEVSPLPPPADSGRHCCGISGCGPH